MNTLEGDETIVRATGSDSTPISVSSARSANTPCAVLDRLATTAHIARCALAKRDPRPAFSMAVRATRHEQRTGPAAWPRLRTLARVASVLLLAGTTEATQLAERLVAGGVAVLSSLAVLTDSIRSASAT
jgi:hypothetical protein